MGERSNSRTIKQSILVLTVKSKHATDPILAKGLSFSGRRHEAEKFWQSREGRIRMYCCSRDHLDKCTEEAECFICAGEHGGSKH